MKKRIISLFAAIIMVVSIFSPVQASAADTLSAVSPADLENATKVITTAINELNGTFSPEQAAATTDIFDQFMSVVGPAGSILTAVNGSVNFLKLIGVIKDSNAEALSNISVQMQTISETIVQMDRKLDNISSQMSKLQASSEFNARTQKTLTLEQNWKDFMYRYEETGMNALITEYRSMLIDSLQSWCGNASGDARTLNGIDNSRIILIYTDNGSGYEPYYISGNEVPSDLPAGARWIILSDELLPQKITLPEYATWDEKTYRTAIRDAIAELIQNTVDAGNFDSFECGNFPQFTEAGSAGLTPALIEETAEDAVNVLAYRIARGCVNSGSYFTYNVTKAFTEYCTHLLAADEGIDAVLKTFFLTHAFEFEISGELKDFCDEIAVKAATYGAFAINILGLSRYASDADKTNVMSAYCNTLNAIGDAKENSLTGRKQYCYITNTELYLGEVRFTSTAQVETKEDTATETFRSAKGGSITSTITGSWDNSFKPDRNSLIGDVNMILLASTMQSGSEPMSFDYLRRHLSNGYIQNCNAFVSSYNGEETLPLGNGAPMRVTNINGSYFKEGTNVSFSNLPAEAKDKTDNFVHRRMVSGSVFNIGSLSVTSQMLTGLAIYGESHWYWYHDEIAILGNNPYQSNFMTSLKRTQQSYQYYFTYDYTQNVTYNCLICKSIPARLTDSDVYDPLSGYIELCDELDEEEPETPSYKPGLYPPHKPVTPSVPSLGDPKPELSVFPDVLSTDPFFSAVNLAAEKGIVFGCEDGLFHPERTCTRAEVLTLLWRAAGCPDSDAEVPFKDVEADDYYAASVRWAYENGIACGTAADAFSPNKTITREQAAAFIYRYAQKLGMGFTGDWMFPLSFDDAAAISDWAGEAVHWCSMKNIVSADEDNLFGPQCGASRGEAVMMIMSLCESISE